MSFQYCSTQLWKLLGVYYFVVVFLQKREWQKTCRNLGTRSLSQETLHNRECKLSLCDLKDIKSYSIGNTALKAKQLTGCHKFQSQNFVLSGINLFNSWHFDGQCSKMYSCHIFRSLKKYSIICYNYLFLILIF